MLIENEKENLKNLEFVGNHSRIPKLFFFFYFSMRTKGCEA